MVFVLDHPLILQKLTHLRQAKTGTDQFKRSLVQIAGLMVYEITKDLPQCEVEIETPVAKTLGRIITKEIILVPILRAGLGLADGISYFLPDAKTGHIGLFRDHETLQPQEYYIKLPENMANGIVYLLDPMLATGGSAVEAIKILKKNGATNIKLVCVVGAPEGVEKVKTAYPEIDVFLCALDEGLNEKGYIIPGLGDAGDRYFGTK